MRAGLGLNAGVLKKHYVAVLQLGLLPWLVECIAISVTSHYLLSLPWIWGKISQYSILNCNINPYSSLWPSRPIPMPFTPVDNHNI